MNKFKINIGDRWGDGHGRCDVYMLESNISKKEIEDAYKRSVETFGISPALYMDDYEDYCFDLEAAFALFKINIDYFEYYFKTHKDFKGTDEEYIDWCYDNDVYDPDMVSSDNFVQIIVDFISLSLDSDQFLRMVPEEETETLTLEGRDQFGYGIMSL